MCLASCPVNVLPSCLLPIKDNATAGTAVPLKEVVGEVIEVIEVQFLLGNYHILLDQLLLTTRSK